MAFPLFSQHKFLEEESTTGNCLNYTNFLVFREILIEIQRLKMEQANQNAGIAAAMRESEVKLAPSGLMQPKPPPSDVDDPQLVAELNALRQRKSELEARMNDLQVAKNMSI